MITRKQIAALYGIHYQTATKLLLKYGIISNDEKKGKGRRCCLTPLEFQIFKNKVGEPLKISP